MRRKRTQVFALTLIITVFMSSHFLYKNSESIKLMTTQQSDERFGVSSVTRKYVTKSLTELGKMDQFNRYFLFLNDVPKSGSEILILLLQKLHGVNSFKHVRMRDGNKRHLTAKQQVNSSLFYNCFWIVDIVETFGEMHTSKGDYLKKYLDWILGKSLLHWFRKIKKFK